MRYELTDYEWAVIKPMLSNKPRGVPWVNDLVCAGRRARAQVTREPARGMRDHRFHGSRLGKQMARARYDLQRRFRAQPRHRLFVELDDAEIRSADDQQRGGTDRFKRIPRQIGTPAA